MRCAPEKDEADMTEEDLVDMGCAVGFLKKEDLRELNKEALCAANEDSKLEACEAVPKDFVCEAPSC